MPEKRQDGERPRILIVDDEADVRLAIRRFVAEDFGPAVFGEAGTADDALERAEEAEWDVVLLDVGMPGRSGLDAIGPLKAVRPGVHVIVVSALPEDPYEGVAIRAGAAMFIPKELIPELLTRAIRWLLGPYASPDGGLTAS